MGSYFCPYWHLSTGGEHIQLAKEEHVSSEHRGGSIMIRYPSSCANKASASNAYYWSDISSCNLTIMRRWSSPSKPPAEYYFIDEDEYEIRLYNLFFASPQETMQSASCQYSIKRHPNQVVQE